MRIETASFIGIVVAFAASACGGRTSSNAVADDTTDSGAPGGPDVLHPVPCNDGTGDSCCEGAFSPTQRCDPGFICWTHCSSSGTRIHESCGTTGSLKGAGLWGCDASASD